MTTPAPPPPPMGGAPQQPNNTQGLVAMILGIVSIPLICFYLGIPLGIVAAILGFMGMKKADQGLATNRGQALAGMITGGIAAGLGILLLILGLILRDLDLPGYTG